MLKDARETAERQMATTERKSDMIKIHCQMAKFDTKVTSIIISTNNFVHHAVFFIRTWRKNVIQCINF